jgi:formimidoylglutamate deiminase
MNASPMLSWFKFKGILQREDWLVPAYVGVDRQGIIRVLSTVPPEEGAAIETVDGYAIPGFQNAHSHAFQYAMAGTAESHPSGTDDDFWTWREAMYGTALTINPDQAEAVAAMLYAEMLRHGYTHVAEFHYLHHDPSGKPYSNLAEMGERMVTAAQTAGIRITLIPVFYQKGGFGKSPEERQRRFISPRTDEYFNLLDSSRMAVKHYSGASLGFSVHSLRAVDLKDITVAFEGAPKDLPFHMHVAEQKKEVADCLAYSKERPMQWVLNHMPVDHRFNLVHSTHLDDEEVKRLASSGAQVVLCPSTEGNLGDGIFRMKEYARLGGRWTIGTDSHIGISPMEELRMIDYRQRLVTNRRNTFDGDAAHYLVNEATLSGRVAMGKGTLEHFAPGLPLDAVVFKANSHLVEASHLKHLCAVLVYTSDSSRILGTLVGGKWIVRDQHHQRGQLIKSEFTQAMAELQKG